MSCIECLDMDYKIFLNASIYSLDLSQSKKLR